MIKSALPCSLTVECREHLDVRKLAVDWTCALRISSREANSCCLYLLDDLHAILSCASSVRSVSRCYAVRFSSCCIVFLAFSLPFLYQLSRTIKSDVLRVKKPGFCPDFPSDSTISTSFPLYNHGRCALRPPLLLQLEPWQF
jgi:hypothetical protein